MPDSVQLGRPGVAALAPYSAPHVQPRRRRGESIQSIHQAGSESAGFSVPLQPVVSLADPVRSAAAERMAFTQRRDVSRSPQIRETDTHSLRSAIVDPECRVADES